MGISRNVVPIVLAAGASSRMGRPKALLDFDGRPAIDLVLGACREAGLGPPIVVVAPAADALHEWLRAAGGDLEIVENPRPERGQTSSLQAGLAALSPEAAGLLIFPVDYVLVRADDVRPLLAAFAGRPPGTRIVIPSHGGRRGHPVVVEAGLAAAFLALGEGATARDVMRAQAEAILHVDAGDRVLADMDTPEDYVRCLERFRRGD